MRKERRGRHADPTRSAGHQRDRARQSRVTLRHGGGRLTQATTRGAVADALTRPSAERLQARDFIRVVRHADPPARCGAALIAATSAFSATAWIPENRGNGWIVSRTASSGIRARRAIVASRPYLPRSTTLAASPPVQEPDQLGEVVIRSGHLHL